MVPELTIDQVSGVLDEVVQTMLAASEIEEGAVNAVQVARRLGTEVAVSTYQSARAQCVRTQSRGGLLTTPQPAILLRPEPRHERRQWAVAHELGELWAERVFDQLDIDARAAESGLRQAIATRLASRLLLPTEWFHPAAVQADWDLTALKRKFDTASHELIARRMLDFIEPAMLITVVDLGRVSFRGSNQRGFRPALTAAEARCQTATHRRGVGTKFQDEQWSIRCWPIHEPGWKREIICAQWDVADFG